MELHKELENIQAKKLYIKIETGTPNAPDFQLSSYLDACIQKNPDKEIILYQGMADMTVFAVFGEIKTFW